jgi:hypothetical protein
MPHLWSAVVSTTLSFFQTRVDRALHTSPFRRDLTSLARLPNRYHDGDPKSPVAADA